MAKPHQDSKVSLETLLRLKRAEKPSPDFWKNFESELRQKQLTALVQKRRWWHEMSILLNRRFYLPAGAAAICALTLVSFRHAESTQIVDVANTALVATAENSVMEILAATEVLLTEPALIQSVLHEESLAIASTSSLSASVVGNDGLSLPALSMTRDAHVPVSHEMDASLSRLQSVENDLGDLGLGSWLGASARVQSASVVQSEVAAMTTASPSKYRLIARYVDRSLSPAPAAPAVVRERLARRLGDDLNDDISRIGVVGSRVSLKF